jgi:hypothetical protein
MAVAQHYGKATLGTTLFEALGEMVGNGEVEEDVAEAVFAAMDKVSEPKTCSSQCRVFCGLCSS